MVLSKRHYLPAQWHRSHPRRLESSARESQNLVVYYKFVHKWSTANSRSFSRWVLHQLLYHIYQSVVWTVRDVHTSLPRPRSLSNYHICEHIKCFTGITFVVIRGENWFCKILYSLMASQRGWISWDILRQQGSVFKTVQVVALKSSTAFCSKRTVCVWITVFWTM